jgi:hypothetical protein
MCRSQIIPSRAGLGRDKQRVGPARAGSGARPGWTATWGTTPARDVAASPRVTVLCCVTVET